MIAEGLALTTMGAWLPLVITTVICAEVTWVYPAEEAFTPESRQFPTPIAFTVITPPATVASEQTVAEAGLIETLVTPSPDPPVTATVKVAAGESE